LTVISVMLVGWAMAAAAEATPFTAPIVDQDSLASPWIPSTTLSTPVNAPMVIEAGSLGSVESGLKVNPSDLENPGDQLALDLVVLRIEPRVSRVEPGPTVLALMGAGLFGMGVTLWRRRGRVA